MTATGARIHFGELLRRVVEGGETITVERGGKPQAVILSVAEYERLLSGPREELDWLAGVDQVRAMIQAELGDRELPPPEDIIREMREERDAQIDAAVWGVRGRQPGGTSHRTWPVPRTSHL